MAKKIKKKTFERECLEKWNRKIVIRVLNRKVKLVIRLRRLRHIPRPLIPGRESLSQIFTGKNSGLNFIPENFFRRTLEEVAFLQGQISSWYFSR